MCLLTGDFLGSHSKHHVSPSNRLAGKRSTRVDFENVFDAYGFYGKLQHTSRYPTVANKKQIFQAISPLLFAGQSDLTGRRPILLASLFIFLCTSVGLALQTNYAAVLILRCIQGVVCGTNTVVAFASITDLVIRAERGKYIFYSSLGMTLGPAIGPTLGGLLTQFLGWRSIFWFMAVIAGVLLLTMLSVLRETCRAVVGNGSLPPQAWNRCALQLFQPPNHATDARTQVTFKNRPGILGTLKILHNRHIALLVLCTAACFCASAAVFNSLATVLKRKYHLRPLYVGLCYLPFTLGTCTTRWTAGTLADRLYKHYAHQVGEDLLPNQQCSTQIQRMPLEKARLVLALPLVYVYAVCVIAFGWVMEYTAHLAGPLVLLFLCGNASSGVLNTLGMLIVDLNVTRPASARAVMSMVNWLACAGASAAVIPLIDAVGMSWLGVILGGMMVLVSPALWSLYFWGKEWRDRKSSSLE